MRTLALVVLTLSGASTFTLAEERPAEGDRIRIESNDEERVGLVEAISDDALVMRPDDEGASSITVPIPEITSLEISRGQRSRGAGAWSKAKWGALFGAVPGAVLLGVQHEQVGENGSSVGKAAALGAWSGGLFGGLIGAAIGALHPGETWEKTSPTFHLRTGRNGFSVSTTITF